MDAEAAIQFRHVSKRFQKRGSGSLRDAIPGLVSGIARRRRGEASPADAFLALDDVSFEVGRGEALGIIGPNGAGKSTTLKLLSGITRPASGEIEVSGRVASLIEVGAGFHQDLTGRENVYLNGAILGMRREEVRRKFDEIVAFAELEEFIDMPVKRYSSGMYMRLGFSVAAYLEPDVLLVDEVLAVGDRRFQAKSIKRMHEVVASGATVVFISHDLNAVQSLCRRGMYLRGGRAAWYGDIEDAIRTYLDDADRMEVAPGPTSTDFEADVDIRRVICRDQDERITSDFITGRPMIIDLEYEAKTLIERPFFNIGITDGRGGTLALASMLVDGRVPDRIEGRGVLRCRFDKLQLLPRTYQIWCEVISEHGAGYLVPPEVRGSFRVVDADPAFVDMASNARLWHIRGEASVYLPYQWEHPKQVEQMDPLAPMRSERG